MRISVLGTLVLALAAAASAAVADGAGSVAPAWAFVVNPPGLQTAPDDGRPRRVPDSTASYTLTQIRDLFAVPDWHAADHPRMPAVVASGRKPSLHACAYCHLPNGLGRPENASLAGLNEAYIAQQLVDFRSGARRSSEPASLPIALMIGVAEAATDAEVQQAAAYFAMLVARPWIRVLESATVPRTQVAGWMLVASEPPATEPIGQRIIEMPEDLERTELRDARSGFVAWVPPGSIARGASLVAGGVNGSIACASCHGADLLGTDIAPPLAGRSPSYLVRQLFDFRQRARNGSGAVQMRAVVAALNEQDMIAIAAFLASRPDG